MVIINSIFEAKANMRVNIALGFFDGVHRGHRAIIESAVGFRNGADCLVFTFKNNPKEILLGKKLPLITDLKEKAELIGDLGVRFMIEQDFLQIKNIEAEDFFSLLTKKLDVKTISCGYDFKFGMNGKGTVQLLERFCEEAKIGFFCMPAVTVGDEKIGSTRIKELIMQGNTERAAIFLGRYHKISGEIMRGRAVGAKLGFATINQTPDESIVQPLCGVYGGFCEVDGKKYVTVTNYGAKPTFGQFPVTAETHIIGYEGDLYGRDISVFLIKYIRPLIKFESARELSVQIEKDIKTAQVIYLNKNINKEYKFEI